MALRFSPSRGAASFALSSAIRGPAGPTGSTGATGATGATGSTGSTGATGPGYLATSTTSNTIASSGSKSFTTQSGLAYVAGTRVRAADSADPSTNYMEGVVTSYSGTTLIFTADRSTGSGTLTGWNLGVAGDVGATGATGATGPSGALGVSGTPTAGMLGVWTNATTQKGVSVTGIVKGNGASDPAAATAGTDYLAPPSGTAILKANSGGALANATAGTDYCAATSGSSVLKGSSGNTAAATAGTDYMHPGTTSLITIGFTVTPNNIGTVSSGTTTPAAASGNYQYLTNNGAFTLAAPAADCAIDLLVTNGASAGSITFSGYTVSASTGDALTTTNTSKFIISIRRINSVATYTIKALQ